MRAFKHLRSVDLEYYRRGMFRLTSLHELARREDLGTMFDPMEGQVKVDFRGPVTFKRGVDPVIDRLFSPNPNATGSIVLKDVGVVARAPDYWIWCASSAVDAEVSADYDAVIRIGNFVRLATLLSEALSTPARFGQVGPVTYCEKRRNFGQPASGNSPFNKDARFAGEREVRIAWPKLPHERAETTKNLEALRARSELWIDGRQLQEHKH